MRHACYVFLSLGVAFQDTKYSYSHSGTSGGEQRSVISSRLESRSTLDMLIELCETKRMNMLLLE